MAVSSDYADFVLEQLSGLPRLASRRMFGGLGLYCDELFFGLISDDVLYFKVDDSNRADYEALGMRRFAPYPDRPSWKMAYYEVPADVLEDREQLTGWARKSIGVASAAARGKRKARAVKPGSEPRRRGGV